MTSGTSTDPQGERVDRLARDGVTALGGAATTALLNLVLTLLLIHVVGRATAGVVFAATSLFLIAETAARVGAPTGLTYFLVRARTIGHVETLRDVLRAGVVPVVAVSVLIASACFAAAPALADWMAHAQAQSATAALRILAVAIPVAALSDSLLMSSRALGTIRPLVVIDRILRPALQVLLTLVVLRAGWTGAPALCAAWVSPYAVSFTLAVVVTRRLVARTERRAGVRPVRGVPPWSTFWRFTSPRAMQTVVQMALQRLDVVLVSAFLGVREAAVYAAVTRFLVFGQLGQQAITAAVQPQLGALMVAGDRAGAGRLYQVSTCWLVLLCWPVYLALAVYSGEVPKIFGRGYDAGTAVLVVLACAMLVATGVGMVDSVLAMAGRTLWTLANTTVALALDVGLNIVLLPRVGIIGAAVAWAAAIVANNVLPLLQVAFAYHLHPFSRGTLLAMASAAGWLGVVPGVVALAGAPLAAIVAASVVGTAGYVLTAVRLSGAFDLGSLGRAVRRRPAGAAAGTAAA